MFFKSVLYFEMQGKAKNVKKHVASMPFNSAVVLQPRHFKAPFLLDYVTSCNKLIITFCNGERV